MEEKIYNVREFAKLVGVSTKTLQRWDRKGILKARRKANRRYYYTKEEHERALSSYRLSTVHQALQRSPFTE